MKGKAEFDQKKSFFSQEIIFFKSEPKKKVFKKFKVSLTFENLKMF